MNDCQLGWHIPGHADQWSHSGLAGAPFNIAPPTVPAAPTLLAATPTAGLQIDLAWTDNSTNETSFKVERSPDGTQVGLKLAQRLLMLQLIAMVDWIQVRNIVIACARQTAQVNSDYSNTSCATTPGEPNNGLNFGSSNAYATFGNPPSLGLLNSPLRHGSSGRELEFLLPQAAAALPMRSRWSPKVHLMLIMQTTEILTISSALIPIPMF